MSNSPIRLLAVDDVAMNLIMLSELLGAAGFVVDTAMTAREGLALASENKYALLLLDIQLPDFNGDVLLQRLRADSAASSAACPAFALTGELTSALRIKLVQSGFAEIYPKPWSASAIVSAVRRVAGVAVVASLATPQPIDLSDLLFDRAQALRTTGGDEKLMLKLRGMLVTELKSKGAALRTAFEQNDLLGLSDQRHKLSGAAGFTGAIALVAALDQLKAEPNKVTIAKVECAISAIVAASMS